MSVAILAFAQARAQAAQGASLATLFHHCLNREAQEIRNDADANDIKKIMPQIYGPLLLSAFALFWFPAWLAEQFNQVLNLSLDLDNICPVILRKSL